MNSQLLQQAIADPTIASLSDADAATALSAPILTPITTRITITTLAGVWGLAKTAACLAAFQAVVAGGGTNGAEAAALLAMLNGPGFDATDPQVQALIPTFVGLANGAITTEDATNALNTTSYRCGGIVAASDVTAARATIAYTNSISALQQQWNTFAGAGNTLIAQAFAAPPGTTVPTMAQLVAAGQAAGT
jgi:hypothetical protein